MRMIFKNEISELKNKIDEINILTTDYENNAKYWRMISEELKNNKPPQYEIN